MFNPGPAKDAAVAELYMQRMMKLQQKLAECGLFDSRICAEKILPQQFVDVGWGSADTEHVCLFGNELRPAVVADKPNVIFESKEGVYYAILLFDADRPDCEETGCYLHWVRRNVTGDIHFSSGRDTFRWQPPHPTGADAHRYFVVVLHQSQGAVDIATQPLIARNSRQGRRNFSLARFMADEGCRLVIGANCFRARYDAATVEPTLAALRDEVHLDASGRKVVTEVQDGVRTEFRH